MTFSKFDMGAAKLAICVCQHMLPTVYSASQRKAAYAGVSVLRVNGLVH